MPTFSPISDVFDIYIENASDKGDKTQNPIANNRAIYYFMQLILAAYQPEETWENAFNTANTPE